MAESETWTNKRFLKRMPSLRHPGGHASLRGNGNHCGMLSALPGSAAFRPFADLLFRLRRDAAYTTADHAPTPPFGDASTIGKGLQMGAKILLLGVGYNRCSTLHCAETKLSKRSVKTGVSVSKNGAAHWKWLYDTDFDADRFPTIGAAFEAQTGSVKLGFAGWTVRRLFSIQQAIDFALRHPKPYIK